MWYYAQGLLGLDHNYMIWMVGTSLWEGASDFACGIEATFPITTGIAGVLSPLVLYSVSWAFSEAALVAQPVVLVWLELIVSNKFSRGSHSDYN